VTDASVAADLRETLDVHGDFSAEITFDHVFLSDDFAEFLDFFVSQIPASGIGIDACLFDDFCCRGTANAIDAGQADLDALISG
jgi:hypothetical protein